MASGIVQWAEEKRVTHGQEWQGGKQSKLQRVIWDSGILEWNQMVPCPMSSSGNGTFCVKPLLLCLHHSPLGFWHCSVCRFTVWIRLACGLCLDAWGVMFIPHVFLHTKWEIKILVAWVYIRFLKDDKNNEYTVFCSWSANGSPFCSLPSQAATLRTKDSDHNTASTKHTAAGTATKRNTTR